MQSIRRPSVRSVIAVTAAAASIGGACCRLGPGAAAAASHPATAPARVVFTTPKPTPTPTPTPEPEPTCSFGVCG